MNSAAVVLVGLGGTIVGVLAGIKIGASDIESCANASRQEANEAVIRQVEEILSRLDARRSNDAPADVPHAVSFAERSECIITDVTDKEEARYAGIRLELTRLAEVIQRSQLLYGGRWAAAHHALLRAGPPNWNVLQRLGLAARDDAADDDVLDEVTFLEPADVMDLLGKPTRIGCLVEGAGQVWRYERDREQLALGQVYGLDIELDSNGLAVRVRNVDIVVAR